MFFIKIGINIVYQNELTNTKTIQQVKTLKFRCIFEK